MNNSAEWLSWMWIFKTELTNETTWLDTWRLRLSSNVVKEKKKSKGRITSRIDWKNYLRFSYMFKAVFVPFVEKKCGQKSHTKTFFTRFKPENNFNNSSKCTDGCFRRTMLVFFFPLISKYIRQVSTWVYGRVPKDVLAGTASLLIQNETQERTTIRVQGM